MAKPPSGPTDRVSLRRKPDRGSYDAEVIHAILDAGRVAHLGIVVDGSPIVIPTLYVRDGDSVLFHGSPASRTLRVASGAAPGGSGADAPEVCLTVTLEDGLVLARSAAHHSMNYRSVVVIGRPTAVTDDEERTEALHALVEHIVPGRWDSLRPMTRKELRGTLVLRLPLSEASAKIRTGPPVDEPADYDLPIWAGVIPTYQAYGAPVPDPKLADGIEVPRHARRW